MARKGRRHSGKKLQPPLPEAKDELNLPKYFGIVRGGGYNKAIEERREIIPGPMPRSGETPGPINGRQPIIRGTPFPGPAPEPEHVPLLVRATRYFAEILGIEPERPVSMPVVPELNYPALYTRYPIMKTVTKTTDVNGEISVTYSHTFVTIPGVVISVKDPDNVFGTIFSTTLTGFEVRLFKMDHDHGGVVDDDGAHTPTINADGDHTHKVQGTGSLSLDTNYGRLVLANYTDYEKDHVHTQGNTYYEDSHTHTNPTTAANNRGHTHGLPAYTGAYDNDNELVVTGWSVGTACASGWCVTGLDGSNVPSTTHWHYLGGSTDGESQSHTHTQGNTGGVPYPGHRHGLPDTGGVTGLGHRHLISNDALYNHYVYNVDLTLDLWTSAKEAPYHAHTGADVPVHGHGVASDGRVLLKNTSVTITYVAQEEST